MVRYFILSGLLLASLGVQAQQRVSSDLDAPQQQEVKARPTKVEEKSAAPAKVDLTRDPGVPAATAPQPNPSLLQPAGQGVAQPYRTMQPANGLNTTTQPVNATSNQFNLGNQKATNTIYYDNAGRVTGSGTSIKLGGK